MGNFLLSPHCINSLRRKRLGVSRGITLQKLRDAVNLLCLTACWKQHLTEQDKRYRESERGKQYYIERLQEKIADLESQKISVSQSQCDTKVLNRIRTVASKYRSQSTDTPRWYWANKLLADLEAELLSE
jgi:phage shock protein A